MATFDSASVGDRRETAGRTITGADLVNFAGVSGDFNHHHTDAERMEDSAFGGRIAHGALVFSVLTGLLWQSRTPDERDDFVALYGVDDLRFTAPVRPGDTVRVETELLGKTERDHERASGVLRYGATVLTGDDEVVLTCELLALVA